MTDDDYRKRLVADYAAAPKVAPYCPICERDALRPYINEDRHRLGLIVSLCRHCGMMLIAPRPGDEWLRKFYAQHYWPLYIGNRYRDEDDLYRTDHCAERADQILDGIADWLPAQIDRYLDVGCGQGGMLSEFRRRRTDTELFGIEPSTAAARFCRDRRGLNVVCGEWLSTAAEQICGPYGLITMTHVVEHVTDPTIFVQQGAARLTEQGRIYIEVPDVLSESWNGGGFFHLAHLQYFTEHSLHNLFARAGLAVEKIFSGLADCWPWAVGAIGRIADAGPLPAAAIPAAPAEYFARLETHLNRRLLSRRNPAQALRRASRAALAVLDRWNRRVAGIFAGQKKPVSPINGKST